MSTVSKGLSFPEAGINYSAQQAGYTDRQALQALYSQKSLIGDATWLAGAVFPELLL